VKEARKRFALESLTKPRRPYSRCCHCCPPDRMRSVQLRKKLFTSRRLLICHVG